MGVLYIPWLASLFPPWEDRYARCYHRSLESVVVGALCRRDEMALDCPCPPPCYRRVKKRGVGAEHSVVQTRHQLEFGGVSSSSEFRLNPQDYFYGEVAGMAEGGLIFTLEEAVVLSMERESVVVLVEFP